MFRFRYKGKDYLDNYSVITYNPQTQELKQSFVGDVDELWNKILDNNNISPSEKYHIKKEGGVIGYQQGGSFGAAFKQSLDEYKRAEA
jgi:hypothetical protein